MRTNRVIVAALACLGAASWSVNADILRVDITAAPGGDGSNWSRAFDSLTDALAAASSGDQLWVAEGVYNPELPVGRDATFAIPDGVQVYGGFVGFESTLAQRGAPLSPPTTLSGTVSGFGSAYSVVTFIGAGSGTILDGFFIIRGNANGPSGGPAGEPRSNGGAIYAKDASPVMRNLSIDECITDGNGGAIFLAGVTSAFTQISDSTFTDNASGLSGGAISADVPVTIERCEFARNEGIAGGALRLIGSGVHTITDCEFRFNDASSGQGGAVFIAMDAGMSFSVITDCEFRSNTGFFAGAVGYSGSGDHTIRSCRLLGNDATAALGAAGAINFDTFNVSDTLVVENSLIIGNAAAGTSSAGGIMNNGQGDLRIVSSTISKNTSVAPGGGGVTAASGATTIDNSILWENQIIGAGGQSSSVFTNFIGTLAVNRTIVQFLGGGSPAPMGTDAIDEDPLFVDIDGPDNTPGTSDDNSRVMPGSPAIDAGSDLVLSPSISADINGDPRYVDDTGTPDTGVSNGADPIVDMGAAEFQGTTPGGGCNEADLAEPFGVLDFTDVIAFLTAYGAMDPDADIAPPFGVYDFSDVLAFLGAYGAGCP